ncbi:granulocyte colony-stimulating factor receptor-like [Carettochelys insculpta]|uniref:granulocyte colony-stimulating factor receptor-like n=1 Tax=Carettochelys insculpta TaxID=44489 RepID=UPI003EBE1EC4
MRALSVFPLRVSIRAVVHDATVRMWLMLSWMFSLGISRSGANSLWQSPGSSIPTLQPSCGLLRLHPSVACLGTPLTASCTLDLSCLQVGRPHLGDIVWRLNGETKRLLLNGSIAGKDTVTAVAILQAEQPRGELSCYLPHRSSLHLLGMAEYQAGVPPRDLQVQHCISFWRGNITCYWDPGPETYLPTTYTLHVTEEAGQCLWKFKDIGTCVSSRESCSCTVPVKNLFAAFKVRLTAVNLLGQASAADKCVHGMSIVKLSPPEVSVTADRSDCFRVAWWQPNEELLHVTDAQYEIRYRDEAAMPWRQVAVTAVEDTPGSKDICGVAPFTNYSVQVRALYRNAAFRWSDGSPFWSNWSPCSFVMTLPAAPSRGPALWRRITTPSAAEREIILMWKPLQPKEANGRILSYHLRWQRKGKPAVLACNTPALQCALELPASEEHTFFLTATNTVGESPATKLSIPVGPPQAVPLPVLVSPVSSHSLLLQWDPPDSTAAAYVFEWGRGPETRRQNSSWRYEPGNIRKVVLAEAIEPGYLYSLAVFALSDGAVWAAGSASAYSQQITPFRAPTARPTRVWPTQVEVQWEEVPLEEQGGFIRNYTVSYEEQGKDAQAVVVNSSVRHCLITGLAPDSVVRVAISASNDVGSTQGPILSIRTSSLEDGKVEFVLSSLCGGLVILLLAAAAACILKHPFLQGYLWPQIPDPAKSHLASWRPQKMWLDLRDLPGEQSEKRGARFSDSPFRGISGIICGQQEKELMMPKSFLEATWTAEASCLGDKDRQPLQPVFLPGDMATADQSQVEYSTVIIWVRPGATPTNSNALWPQPPTQSPDSSRPSCEPGCRICFQGSSCGGQQPEGGLASLGAFPLLRTLVVEGSGDLQPHGDHSAPSPATPSQPPERDGHSLGMRLNEEGGL